MKILTAPFWLTGDEKEGRGCSPRISQTSIVKKGPNFALQQFQRTLEKSDRKAADVGRGKKDDRHGDQESITFHTTIHYILISKYC